MFSSPLTPVNTDELLQRINSQPVGNVWSAIVTNPSEFEELVDELDDSITLFAECEVELIFAEEGVLELVRKVKQSPKDYLILCEFEEWNEEEWRRFDYFRSGLDQHKRGGVLLLSLESAKNLLRYAPNFTSWLGARVYSLNLGTEVLTEDEREKRLAILREWSHKTDSEILQLAEAKELPPDPEYGEWLVLLGRGDLIER